MKFFIPILSLFMMVSLFSCKKANDTTTTINPYKDAYTEASEYLNLPETAHDYTVDFPNYLRNNSFFAPTTDNEKATLGRVLFYDKNISRTKEVSCASCHIQEMAFADGKQFSDGVSGRQTARNSIGLGSTISFGAYYGSSSFFGINFFWDDRAASVAEQSRASLTNSKEMDMDMDLVVERVKENQQYYKWLFLEAYPDGISEANILDAIQQFVNSMGSFDSPYDKGMESTNGNEYAAFSGWEEKQLKGKDIFMENCTSCHSKFAARSSIPMANNGLAMVYSDKGKGALTNNSSDNAVFKVPSLRNVELTAPYMHDGSLKTLEDVVEHYSTGVVKHPNLSTMLKTNSSTPKHLNLNASDKEALVAFLKTFTDTKYTNPNEIDERYSNPFK